MTYGCILTIRMLSTPVGIHTSGNNDSEPGIGGKANAMGIRTEFSPKAFLRPTGAGKLNKSGATTKSESLSRLRGKGALA